MLFPSCFGLFRPTTSNLVANPKNELIPAFEALGNISDFGAHTTIMCGAGHNLMLLTEWVRGNALEKRGIGDIDTLTVSEYKALSPGRKLWYRIYRSPLVLFQRLMSNWDDDHRPLQFEDFSMRPDDLYRKRYLRRLVEDMVKELPEHHRLVFRLRELEGKSYEEISEITGVNLGTVKSRLHRARNSFAQRIEPFLN